MTLPPSRFDSPDFTLRAWSVDDAPRLQKTLEASDAHLRQFTPWVVDGRVPGQSLEDRLRQHAADFAGGAEWVYGMFRPADGLATRAAAVLTRFAFADQRIDRVEIHCDPDNVASVAVPRRLGYRIENRTSGRSGTDNLMIWRLERREFEPGSMS